MDRLRSEEAVGGCVLALLIGVALAPVLLVPIPAMVDYPNHLARMYILAADGTANANPHYQVQWALYPNLAMDLVIPQWARLIGVENATRFFLLLGQILIVSGAIALEFAVKGRARLSGFAAVMFLYCLPFTWGFVNFEFALGVALWGIAAMLTIAERSWPLRLATNAAYVIALFAAHFFSLGIYGAVLGLHELWRAWERRASYSETALRLLVLAIPAAAVLAVMAITGGAIGNSGTHWHFGYKPLWLFSIMNGYSLTVSAATAAVLIGWLYVAAKRGVLKFAPAGPYGWRRVCAALSRHPVAAFQLILRRPARARRGGVRAARVPDAVAAEPALVAGEHGLRKRGDARQSRRGLFGLATLPRRLCGDDCVLRQDRKRARSCSWPIAGRATTRRSAI